MPVNKVVFGAVSIMDISDSTVTPETLAAGKTAYDKAGNKITGTMQSAEDLTDVLDAQESKLNSLLESLDRAAAGNPVLEPLSVTENGTYTPPDGIDGFNEVVVSVANSGGSQPSGVCPSLTITGYSDVALEFIFYSSGGRYYSTALSGENYTLTNVDVNQVIVIKYRTINTDDTVLKTTNIEVLNHTSSQDVILKCTSTDAATLIIEKDASSPWG